MTRKFQKRPPGDLLAFEVDGHRLWAHTSLSEFFVVMALSRQGPSSATGVAREVSTWLDTPLPPEGLKRTLQVVSGLGWASHSAGIYAITSKGIAMMRACHVACMRMAGGGSPLPGAAKPTCFDEAFERS